MVVTIDGPAGAGKSTVARRLAERIGYRYLDTGAMYRAVTLCVLLDGADPVEAAASGAWRTYEGDARLRSPDVDAAVSAVAQAPAVRLAMRAAQRAFLAEGDAVAEGRDIGDVVWPQAELKVWLDAAPDVRARRRGTTEALERDRRDQAQTRLAPDAVSVDTTQPDDRAGGRGSGAAGRGADGMSTGAPGDNYTFMGPEALWRLARVFLQSWFAPMMRLRVYGVDRVPSAGAAVLASNHIAADDPVVLGMASPRSIRYMAKAELWRVPVLAPIITRTGTFPVDRGKADREAIRNARAVLRSGHLLGIFVEGTRQSSTEIGEARTGAAMFAVLEGARIIPVCLFGTDHHGRNPFHQAAVAWGTPIDVSGVPRGAKGYRAIAHAIEEELRALRDFLQAAERAGYPRDAVPPVSRATVEV